MSPQQIATSAENNFIGGLKTEFTGLNFPENSCTDADNVVFSLIGDVDRRKGINYEANFQLHAIDRTENAISSYKWNNVGGDGNTEVLVQQVGNTISFYVSSEATDAAPLSSTALVSTVSLSDFHAPGNINVPSETECQFSDGNGYLFVFHKDLEPFYCTYVAGVITTTLITVRIRDFLGIVEPGVAPNLRPASLSAEHKYNLLNQGWSSNPPWTASDNSSTVTITTGTTGNKAFTVASGLTIVNGTAVQVFGTDLAYSAGPLVNILLAIGTVTSYSGTTLTINITSATDVYLVGTWPLYNIYPLNVGFLNTWNTALGTYPSNADVWWNYKNGSNVFDPAATVNSTTLNSGPSPKGFYILDAFRQNRAYLSGVSGITEVNTAYRPKTGTWFQGRIWYAGVDDAQAATGDQPYYTWTENIYFSQIVEDASQFGMCYQTNDPTSEGLFDLLPTDGGVLTIQGSGSIYKLFPIQNGMLVFATNGIWFITGSQGIGFSANDYTITKISSVQTISACSFIDILGYPMFWNQEGIYHVSTGRENKPYGQGGLVVNNICLGSILKLYTDLPDVSKRYARGDYDLLNFTVSWVYKDVMETDRTSRYQFNRVLNFNTANNSFYTYTVPSDPDEGPCVHDIKFISYPGSTTSPDPTFKYMTSIKNESTYDFTFSEERDDTDWVDFISAVTGSLDYASYFITGYKLHGKALFKWQPSYVYVYSRADIPMKYTIQGIWDYAASGNSGRYSVPQIGEVNHTNYGMIHRRFKIRGQGLSLQLKVNSITGKPFNIMGWAIYETINAGV